MAKVIGIIVLIALVLVFGPLLTIWSLNTLFPTVAIPYTLSTWAAVVLLVGGPLKGFNAAFK